MDKDMKNILKIFSPLKKSPTVLVSFILSFFCLSLILIQFSWVSNQNKKIITYDQTGPGKFQAKYLTINMEIPDRSDGTKNCWQEENGTWGSQYDIYIYNNTDYAFVDWNLEISVPKEARIDSCWNGEFSQTPGFIKVKGDPETFTLIASAHNSIKIGFVLYTNQLLSSSSFHLTGRFLRNPIKNKLFFSALVIFFIVFLIFIISNIVYYIVKKQQNIDNEKIESLIKLCARFIDVRDEYTKMHSSHVGDYARKIAEKMGFNEEFQKNIYYMGMMHDVGKVLLPREILCKTSKLNDEEWKEMKKHPLYSAGILEGFTAVPGIKEAALYHHERYDGSGYPTGLREKEIPIQARIICVADSYDAMHTNRSYRSHLSDEVILQELEKNKGSQFDPDAAEALITLIKEHKL